MAASMLAYATDGTKLPFTSDGETAPKSLFHGLPPVYQGLNTYHDWPVKMPLLICQLGWREHRNAFSPVICRLLGAQNKDIGVASQTLLTGIRLLLRNRLRTLMLNNSDNWLISKIDYRIGGPFSMCFVALKVINDLKYRETMGKREREKKIFSGQIRKYCNRY